MRPTPKKTIPHENFSQILYKMMKQIINLPRIFLSAPEFFFSPINSSPPKTSSVGIPPFDSQGDLYPEADVPYVWGAEPGKNPPQN